MTAYKGKYKLAKIIALVASMVAIIAIYYAVTFYKTAQKNKGYAESLLDSQNVMIWTMDSSCYQQLQGSEGIIRLDIKKVGEK